MEPYNLEGRSRGSSFRRRALTLVGVSALTLSGVGAAVFGASQAFATSWVAASQSSMSSSYSIGTGSVGNLTFSSTNYTTSKTAQYTVDFTATDGIPGGKNIYLALNDATTTGAVTGTLTDMTTGNSQSVSIPTISGSTAVQFPVSASGISAGHQLSLAFAGVKNSATATTSAKVTIYTDGDTAPISTSYTIVAGTTSPNPTSSASSDAENATSVTWTLGNFGVYDNGTPATTTLAAGAVLDINIPGSILTLTPSNYVITDTPSTGSAATQNPSKVALKASGAYNEVNITTSSAITVGDTITITISDVQNPSANTIQPTLGITPVVGNDAWVVAVAGTAASSGTVSAALFGTTTISGTVTAVTGVSVTPSPAYASTSSKINSSTFTATFTATSGLATGKTITVQLAPGETVPAGTVIVTDTSAGTSGSVTGSPGTSTSPASSTPNIDTITTNLAISTGDVVSVEIFGVNNPTTTGSFTAQVFTFGDSVPVSAGYSLSTAPTTTASIVVATSTEAAGASATYTITGLENTTGAALPAGAQISLGNTSAATGTSWPLVASAYQITDLTNAAASGVATAIEADGNFYGVDLIIPNAIASNDLVTIQISGVTNPYSGGSYVMQFYQLGQATVSTAAPAAPNAATTMASGSLVQTGGTIYVVAGGVAFGIPTFSDYSTIANGLGDPTVVQSATAPSTTGTVASGTLVQVVGSSQIDVVGSGNTAYGFSTASEFTGDGYSFAKVIQIPSLGNLTVGSGAAPNAATTMASGSLVQTGGTIYVVAGGVAFGIPTFSDYSTIANGLGDPTVVQSATAPSTTGTVASGTLVQVVGSGLISVYSSGTAVGFSTPSEFTGDGYSFANVIMIP